MPTFLVVEDLDVLEERLRPARVAKSVSWINSIFKLLKKLSTTALSQQVPLRLMLQRIPRCSRTRW